MHLGAVGHNTVSAPKAQLTGPLPCNHRRHVAQAVLGGGGHQAQSRYLGLGPQPNRVATTSPLVPSRNRNQINTAKVHGVDGDDPEELEEEAQRIADGWWQEAMQDRQASHQGTSSTTTTTSNSGIGSSSWPSGTGGRHMSARNGSLATSSVVSGGSTNRSSRTGSPSGHGAEALLHVLLPCLLPAVTARALNDASLRAAADVLGRLSVPALDRQEAQVLSLLSGVLSRSHDAEPEERLVRNGVVRTMWEGFAAARVAGSVDSGVVSPMQAALQDYRQAYRRRTLGALSQLVSHASVDGVGVASRLVMLRGLVHGNMSQLILRYPALMNVPMTVLQQIAGKALPSGPGASHPPSAAVHLDQALVEELFAQPDQDAM